jgi:hypothetical protein
VLAEPGGEVRDVQRGPAHVQAGDHAENLDGTRLGTRR